MRRSVAGQAGSASAATSKVPRWAMCFASAWGYEEAPAAVVSPGSAAPPAALSSSSFAASFDQLRRSYSRLPDPEPEPESAPLEAALAWAEAEWGAGALSRSAHHAGALRFHVLMLFLLTFLLPEQASAGVRTVALAALVPVILWLGRATAMLRQVAERAHEPLPAREDSAGSAGPSVHSGAIHNAHDAHADAPGRMAHELPGLRQTAGMPPLAFWGEPAATSYRLRSRSYLSSGVKRPSAPPIFSLFALDCFQCEDAEDRYNLIGRPDHWLNSRGAAGRRTVAPAGAHGTGSCGRSGGGRSSGGGGNGGGGSAGVSGGGGVGDGDDGLPGGYTFVLNIIIPSANNLVIVAYFRESSPGVLASDSDAAVKLFRRWVSEGDAFRDERLKLIPRVAKGPMLVRKGVGAKPVLLGKRISVFYFQQPAAFEVDLDVSSDRFADKITRLVRDAMANSVCLDLAVTIEGRSDAELPERILAAVRCDHIDFKKCTVTLPSRKRL